MQTNKDLLLSNYNYDIPQELIAQVPAEKRSSSKLIILNRKKQTITHKNFFDIVNILGKNDCLVINTTKVVPARLYGKKSTGGKVELLFLNPTQEGPRYAVLLKPNIRKDHKVYFDDGYECSFVGTDENGNKIVEFNKKDVQSLLEKHGFMPLPPYIKRKDGLAEKYFDLDKTRYQTIYAKTDNAKISIKILGRYAIKKKYIHNIINTCDKIFFILLSDNKLIASFLSNLFILYCSAISL